MGTERRLALVLGLALGCASPVVAPVEPPHGGVFSFYSAPLETNFAATPVGSKVGEAQLHHLEIPVNGARIPVFSLADASIAGAAAEAGITKIYYADYQVISVLGIYVQLTVRVSGD